MLMKKTVVATTGELSKRLHVSSPVFLLPKNGRREAYIII